VREQYNIFGKDELGVYQRLDSGARYDKATSDKKPGHPKGSKDYKPRPMKSIIRCHSIGICLTSPQADSIRFNIITESRPDFKQRKMSLTIRLTCTVFVQQPIVNNAVIGNISDVHSRAVNSDSSDAQLFPLTQKIGEFHGIADPFRTDWA
jgi:hypothetical protein